jgi:hypothetical protein
MATHFVRKGSIYGTGIVLKTKTKFYFYGLWYGISHFQNYYAIPNPNPPAFHDINSIRKALNLCPPTQTPYYLVRTPF